MPVAQENNVSPKHKDITTQWSYMPSRYRKCCDRAVIRVSKGVMHHNVRIGESLVYSRLMKGNKERCYVIAIC